MNSCKRKHIGRIVVLMLSAPIVLFVALLTLLYLPPVQKFAVREATQVASNVTRMSIYVGRLRLAFPFDLALNDVVVCDSVRVDTLASIGEFRIGINPWPLIRGKVEVKSINLTDAMAHTGELFPSIEVNGRIGRLTLRNSDIELSNEIARVKSLMLHEGDVSLTLHKKSGQQGKSFSPVGWKIFLGRVKIDQANMRLLIPSDTLDISSKWETTEVRNLAIDLGDSAYDVSHFTLSGGAFSYANTTQPMSKELDPHHVQMTNISVAMDSLHYKPKEASVILQQLSMEERSSFRLTHSRGRIHMDNSGISLPYLWLESNSSYLQAKGHLPWSALKEDGNERLSVWVDGRLSLTDFAMLDSSILIHKSPMNIHISLQGNATHLQLDTLALEMDSVVNLNAHGKASYLTDDKRRTGEAKWDGMIHNPQVINSLIANHLPSIQIPEGMDMKGLLSIDKTRYNVHLDILEKEGYLSAKGFYNTLSEEYALYLRTDSFPLHRFLPHTSLGHLTAHSEIEGRGLDPYDQHTHLSGNIFIDSLIYDSQIISNVGVNASLQEHQADVECESHNHHLNMQARIEGLIHRDSLKARATMSVEETTLSALRNIRLPMNASALVDIKPDSLYTQLSMGDLEIRLNGGDDPKSLIESMKDFTMAIKAQLNESKIFIEKATKHLPNVQLTLKAGKKNPIVDYLYYTKGVDMEEMDVNLCTSPHTGLFANGHIYCLQADSLEFDTVNLNVSTIKDSALVANLTVSNAPNKRKPVFTSSLRGEVSNKHISTLVQFYNDKQRLGLELGANASIEGKEVRLSFFPEKPTIGFRTFTLNEGNYIALGDSGKVEAHVEMLDNYGTGLRLYSTPNEEAKQDLTIDLTQLNLTEILGMLPYAPDISCTMDAEFHYLKTTEESNTFSGTLRTENLTYEGYAMGAQEWEAVYLPISKDKHLINLQWITNDKVTTTIDGSYWKEGDSGQEGEIQANVKLDKLSLDMANAFLPREMVKVSGSLNGELSIKGHIGNPYIDGEIHFDSTKIHSPLYAVDFTFDENPIRFTRNRLSLDDFHIYSKGRNPFVLSGNIDFKDFSHPEANLQMQATEYELLNAKKSKNSVLYGKVLVSISSTIKGELTNPIMRGNMNVLGNTDVTYILEESPLTVEDRLGSMVTFVNFNDTTTITRDKKDISIGGIDLLLNIQIDPGAQIQADLGSDNYVEVQGGGHLSMQYTPQGELLLIGRYTLNRGEMKYSLPVIPLKTFNITEGSYVDFTGNPSNPNLNITATERVRTSVTENNNSRYVNFDVGVTITQTLEDMGLTFTLEAPEDVTLQNQLASMSAEERGKLAVTMLVTGMYMGGQGGSEKGFNTNNALNSFLQNEISNIAGNALKTMDVSIGVEDNITSDGSLQGGTDYSFRFAKRFWDNRLSVIIGGRISTGNDAKVEENESFIDDISLEWRLDKSGTRYIKLFHTKNYESILEGEIVETGVGLVLRRKVDKLGELFIFRRKE